MRSLSKAFISCFTAFQVSCDNHTDDSIPYISSIQYRANTKIEDRVCYGSLERIKGIVAAVFDGHGGDLVAQYAAGNLIKCVNQRINKNIKKSSNIKKVAEMSLSEAFDDVQNGYKAIFLNNIDDIEYQRVGACALAAIITRNTLTVANSGDCEGVLLGNEGPIKINNRHNAGEPNQQKRLQQEFPEQKDIYKCIPGTNYCYVKGRLQPTRSLGDFYLKGSEYNFTNLAIFTGPYITHKPEITHFDLHHSYKTLVLASDGLWDELDQKQIDSLYRISPDANSLVSRLLQEAKRKIRQRNIINEQNLQKLEQRRNLHDDISIVGIDLQDARETLRSS